MYQSGPAAAIACPTRIDRNNEAEAPSRADLKKSNLIRSALIRATAAMAGTPALAASVAQREITDPLLALGKRYQDAVAKRERESAAVDRIWDAFPETAKDFWPLVDRSLPIFRDFPENNDPEFTIGHADLHDIEKFNAVCEKAAAGNPEKLVAEKADGAARIRWFEDYMSTLDQLHEESGYNAQHERYEAAVEAVDVIEAEMIETRPGSIAGLSTRLCALRDFLESNNTSYGETRAARGNGTAGEHYRRCDAEVAP